MSRFTDIFGKKPDSSPPKEAAPAAAPARTAEELRKDPNYIRVFDSFGREMFMTKEQWRSGTLPGALKANWNSPDKLYGILAMALNDGHFTDILEAACRLYRIDPNPSRGAAVYAIVLMKTGKLDRAEEVLRSYLKAHGDDGVILTNLAKVQAARNEMPAAEETLWRALLADPNMENALAWHLAIHKERDGETSKSRELERIAALPGSWRAQLWLARAALESSDLDRALALYREGLSHIGRPAPAHLLLQVSGDLGNYGHLSEALQLVEPEFVPKLHGLLVGNNLIKAHLDLGEIDAAAGILEQLYSLQRPDWKERLSFWDTELAKARIVSANAVLSVPIDATLINIEGPVWLKPSSPANSLFSRKPTNKIFVCFLGGSATVPRASQQIQEQLADTPGRLSRALPLFLAEQVHFFTESVVQTLIPWIQGERGAFMVSGSIWTDADAARYAKVAQPKSQFVVVTHLTGESAESSAHWGIQLRLIQVDAAQCVAALEGSFSLTDSEDSLLGMSRRLVELVAQHTEKVSVNPPALYQLPKGRWFSDYLLRIEQLLAARCTGMEHDGPDFLSGKREIVDGMLGLCLACPSNVVVRILLAETLSAMKRIQPNVEAEFRERVQRLQKQNRLAEPANGVVEWILGNGPQTTQ
jgi:tetratricopeptide (TPR) repeat protein